MPFFDIMDEVVKHQVEKNETGENRIFGAVIGQVTKNYDKERAGYIQISINARDYTESKQVWARMAFPYSGSKWGEYFIPEIGDQVIVVFEHGNIARPFVVGCIPKDNDQFLTKSVDEKNKFKKITTKNGNTITFEDNPEGDGEKDKIFINTSKEANKIHLDNEKKIILISDKEGENKIEMKNEQGQMEIIAKQKLTIKVGDNIKIIMNGSNGTIDIQSTKIKAEASNSVNISSNTNMKMEGGNVTVNGNSILKLSSSGPVSVEGTPVKLG
ncbi:MAG: phage baseplate assembly protein V [Lachnospiraceae bacterium]|nr:phage baseplate assembly protein V [Lachnospiraceae bacterium]